MPLVRESSDRSTAVKHKSFGSVALEPGVVARCLVFPSVPFRSLFPIAVFDHPHRLT